MFAVERKTGDSRDMRIYRILFTVCSVVSVMVNARDIPLFNVRVVAGDSARLPCNISTTEPGDSVLLVLWYREELGTPIYSMDARERDFSQAERWSDDTVFGSRAYFLVDKYPAALGVENVQEGDEDVYRCRVDFKVAQTRNSKVNLTVIVPPSLMVIEDENGMNRTSVVGPYAEGTNILMYCDVYGGRPTPTVEWYRDDHLVSNNTVSMPGGRVRAEVSMRALSRADLHSSLRCRAYNNHRRPPLEDAVLVDMNLRPLDVRLLGLSQPLSAGRRYDLLCQSSGSRPPAKITWWLDKKRLDRSKETTSNDGNTTTSTLSFTVSKDDADKSLVCRAENTVIISDVLEDNWRLQVHYIPEVQIQLGTSLSRDNIREGSDVYFDCHVKAQPPVYRVEWRHNDKVLGPGAGRGVILSNQSLVLQSVGRTSGGNYTCVGVNSEGAGHSRPFYLNVLYSPTCKPNQSRVIGVAKQERANISCEVEANPANVTFRWSFNNSAENMDVAPAHIAREGPVSYVSYTPVTELDYGTLLCWAINRVGRQKSPCVFHIVAAGRPDQVHNCSVGNVSTTSFTVRCSEGFNGGLPQSFLLEVREAHSQNLKANVSAGSASFSVTGLTPGERYHACVYSYNLKGRSEPVVLTAATIRTPERHLPASQHERPRGAGILTPALSVVAGVAAALLVVALGVATLVRMFCYRRNQHRKGNDLADQRVASSPTSISDKCGVADSVKLDPGGGEGDDKNPDVIPQPMAVEPDERVEFLAARYQHISTIETTSAVASPSRVRQPQVAVGDGYAGFCTLRNGMPLRDLAMPSEVDLPPATSTLPRHWPVASPGSANSRRHLYSSPVHLHAAEQQMPLVGQNKRESTV